jgi:G3E family GTPase
MVPAFVITGFLGSGKTTLLLNVARTHLGNRRVAVIVNEVGEVGVDGKVLENAYSRVVELSQGCICCTIHAEFERAVEEIRSLYDPEVLLVETSGSSEPFPVMISLQSLGFSLEGVLCVVDTPNFHRYRDNPTAKFQIGGSNIIVLNKLDLAGEEVADLVESEVRRVWEENRIRNVFTGEEVFRDVKIYRAVYGRIPREVLEGSYTLRDLENVGLGKGHRGEFSQRVLYLKEPADEAKIREAIASLPEGVVRVKGIVRLRGLDHPVLVNYAFGLLDMGAPVPHYEGPSFLVLISAGDHTPADLKLL